MNTMRRMLRAINSALLLVISFFILAFIFMSAVFIIGGMLEMRRMEAGDYPLADTSEVVIDGRTFRLERYAVHPFLAEYKRILTVRNADGAEFVSELNLDSGGAGRLAFCRIAEGEILISDRFGSYRVAENGEMEPLFDATISKMLSDGSMESITVPERRPGCIKQLGAFDRDQHGDYGFQPPL